MALDCPIASARCGVVLCSASAGAVVVLLDGFAELLGVLADGVIVVDDGDVGEDGDEDAGVADVAAAAGASLAAGAELEPGAPDAFSNCIR